MPAEKKDKPYNSEELEKVCEQYILYLSGEFTADRLSDYKNNIFEKALEMFYGDDVWDYVNERIE
jgi:hypothetical protein